MWEEEVVDCNNPGSLLPPATDTIFESLPTTKACSEIEKEPPEELLSCVKNSITFLSTPNEVKGGAIRMTLAFEFVEQWPPIVEVF